MQSIVLMYFSLKHLMFIKDSGVELRFSTLAYELRSRKIQICVEIHVTEENINSIFAVRPREPLATSVIFNPSSKGFLSRSQGELGWQRGC